MKKILIGFGVLAVWLIVELQPTEESVEGHWCIHELHRSVADFSSLKRSGSPVTVCAHDHVEIFRDTHE